MPPPRTASRRRRGTIWVLGVGLALSGAAQVASGVRTGAAAATSDLCDPASCSVQVSESEVNLGGTLSVNVRGNPATSVTVQAYLVEFNSSGAVTDLIPAGDPATGITNGSGRLNRVALVPTQPDGFVSGGWLFVGLADDATLDFSQRLGDFVGFGGDSLRLLGDGYAAQKPVGVELQMDVIGQVPQMHYWVQYRDQSGNWVDAPGQSYHDAQQLAGPPNQRRQISYVVPETLPMGVPTTFRINSELNFGGSPQTPVADPAYVTWQVIGSEDPITQDRGDDFDPTLSPGDADPTDGPTGDPTSNPTGTPTGTPTGGPSGTPTGTPTSQPTTEPTTQPSNDPTTEPTDESTDASTDAPTEEPAESPAAEPSDSTDPALVWGDEATSSYVSSAPQPVSSSVSGLIGIGLGLLALAPLGWWLIARRRGRAASGWEETL